MANPSIFASVAYEAETNWAEAVSTFATHRIPTTMPVDVSGLTHTMVPSEHVEQRRQAGNKHVLMTQGGSFTVRLDWAGHGSTMVGSPTVDAVETFIARTLGATPALSLATSSTLTGGTAAAPTTTGATGVTAGGLVRLGALGDGDGNGQMYPVSTHATSTLNMLVDLDGAPANGAVFYPVVMIHPATSATSTAVTGTRFQLVTSNYTYNCHGCYPMSWTFSGLNPGERPQIEITWGVSRWAYSATTLPISTTSNRYLPGPIAAGSLHVQDVGTTTRDLFTCRNFTLEWNLGIGPAWTGRRRPVPRHCRRGPDRRHHQRLVHGRRRGGINHAGDSGMVHEQRDPVDHVDRIDG